MVEMVDTSDLGSDALRDGFESLYPDQYGNPEGSNPSLNSERTPR